MFSDSIQAYIWNKEKNIAFNRNNESWWQEKKNPNNCMYDNSWQFDTVEPDLIATEMSVFPSKSSRDKTDSDLMITTP